MTLLAGRHAIVTGGAAGIGAAVARRFVEEGASVAILDTDVDRALEVAEPLDARVQQVDVASTEGVTEAVQEAAAVLGGLTVLVNNAGTGSIGPLHRYHEDEWDRLLAVNLKGVWNGIRAAAPLIRLSGGGAIVNVASVSGLRPTRGEAPYSAAKAGVIALTKSAALEYAPEIRVNGVAPGFVHTGLTDFAVQDEELRTEIEAGTPLGRVGRPDEVADVVVFLASGLSSYLTGETIVVDGGAMLPSPQADPVLTRLLWTLG